MNKYLWLLILPFLLCFQSDDYQECHNEQGLIFSYRWLPQKYNEPDSPLELLIRVKNTNSVTTMYSYKVRLFMDGKQVESFMSPTRCLKKNKTAMGRLNGDYYRSNELTNDQIRSEKFSFEIEEVQTEEVAKCP